MKHESTDGSLPVVLDATPDGPVLRPVDEAPLDVWRAGGAACQGDLAVRALACALENAELIDQRSDHVYVRPGRAGQ